MYVYQFLCATLFSLKFTLVRFYLICICVMQWLRNFDQRLRESMEYALCLNSLGSSSDRMWLHVSKPPENAFIKQILSVCSLSLSFMY